MTEKDLSKTVHLNKHRGKHYELMSRLFKAKKEA